jgi:hypothetical protein
MIFCARSGSFQRPGSSTKPFSSASLCWDASQSKMPPQQGHTLLDLVDDGLDLGTHGAFLVRSGSTGRRRSSIPGEAAARRAAAGP